MSKKDREVVNFSTRSVTEVVPRLPLFASRTPGESCLYLEYHHQPPHELPEHTPNRHLVVIHDRIKSPLKRERWLDGELQAEQTRNADVFIVPADVSHRTYWDSEHSYLLLSLDPHWLSHVTQESIAPDKISLKPLFPKNDPLLYHLGLSLKTELETQGWNNRLYLESMANTIATHILRHYCTSAAKTQPNSNGLSQSQLKQVNNYINDLLDSNLSLAELAAVVNISPNYFATLFKQATGVSPHQYVTRRRVESAKQLLKNSRLSHAEIALKVGFANSSHFSTVFRKQTGMTPRTYRNAFKF